MSGLTYGITRSKVSLIMNLAEFIPFLGDFLPVYTVSTLIWIVREQGGGVNLVFDKADNSGFVKWP